VIKYQSNDSLVCRSGEEVVGFFGDATASGEFCELLDVRDHDSKEMALSFLAAFVPTNHSCGCLRTGARIWRQQYIQLGLRHPNLPVSRQFYSSGIQAVEIWSPFLM
jgi:hypothetical protein